MDHELDTYGHFLASANYDQLANHAKSTEERERWRAKATEHFAEFCEALGIPSTGAAELEREAVVIELTENSLEVADGN